MELSLDDILMMLLVAALHRADRIPTPQHPPDPAAERAAETLCLMFCRTLEPPEDIQPHVAAALVARLRHATLMSGFAQSYYGRLAGSKKGREGLRVLLEILLVELWNNEGRENWLAGKLR